MIFNPFVTNNLPLNSELDPVYNYYHKLLNYLDQCSYYQVESFNNLIGHLNSNNMIISVLHKLIWLFSSIYKCVKAQISVIGLSETWLNKENNNNYPLPNYNYIGKLRENKQGGGVGLNINDMYQFSPRKCLLTLHNTLVYPYLSYCNITWTSRYPTRLQSILMIHKKLVRIMTLSNYRELNKRLFTSPLTRNHEYKWTQQIFCRSFHEFIL